MAMGEGDAGLNRTGRTITFLPNWITFRLHTILAEIPSLNTMNPSIRKAAKAYPFLI
jgi:hypothetical protein